MTEMLEEAQVAQSVTSPTSPLAKKEKTGLPKLSARLRGQSVSGPDSGRAKKEEKAVTRSTRSRTMSVFGTFRKRGADSSGSR